MSRSWFTVSQAHLTLSLLSSSDLPNEMAWGTKKKMFYDTDYVTTSEHLLSPEVLLRQFMMILLSVWLTFAFNCAITEGKSQEELEAEEQEEEEEAKNIQKRLAANLSEEDYDLNFFQVFFFLIVILSSTPAVNSTCDDKKVSFCLFWLFFVGCLNEGICCGGEG